MRWVQRTMYCIWVHCAQGVHIGATTEPSMCSGDVALCQITLATCFVFKLGMNEQMMLANRSRRQCDVVDRVRSAADVLMCACSIKLEPWSAAVP